MENMSLEVLKELKKKVIQKIKKNIKKMIWRKLKLKQKEKLKFELLKRTQTEFYMKEIFMCFWQLLQKKQWISNNTNIRKLWVFS